jgi:hypothetical protein
VTFCASGLIGHTGFVGGTLMRARSFNAAYNSSNISDIEGSSFDRLVCAGVPAAKWIANKDPDGDRAAIARLTGPLSNVNAREFILVSTIDVYLDPTLPNDEDSFIDPDGNHAYGRHRFELERWARDHFDCVRIVRLPALFGAGLKKNAIFDLLHENQVDKINPLGEFQWYPLRRLSDDLDLICEAGLSLVNLFPEPVSMPRIIAEFFPSACVGPPSLPAPRYRLRSRHAALFGGSNGYLMTADEMLSELATFLDECRAVGGHEKPGR